MKHLVVQDALYSPNGKTVLTRDVSCGRLWSAVDGSPIGGPLGPEFSSAVYTFMNNVTYSPDGETVLTVDTLHGAKLWRASDATLIGEVSPHDCQGSIAAFSPDGKFFLTGSRNGASCLWSTETRSRLGPIFSHNFEQQFTDVSHVGNGVAFTPDGLAVLAADVDDTSRSWSLAGTVPKQPKWPCGDDADDVAAISPDRRTVLTLRRTNDPGTARLWSATDGSPAGITLRHEGYVWIGVFSPDRRFVLTGSDAGTARLWNSGDGTPVGQSMKHTDKVEAVAFSPDGRFIVTGSHDKTAHLWRERKRQLDDLGRPITHASDKIWRVGEGRPVRKSFHKPEASGLDAGFPADPFVPE